MKITKTDKRTWLVESTDVQPLTDFHVRLSQNDWLHGGLASTPAEVELEDCGYRIRISWPENAINPLAYPDRPYTAAEIKKQTLAKYAATKRVYKKEMGYLPR